MSITVKRPAGTVPVERRWPKQLKAWMAARRGYPPPSRWQAPKFSRRQAPRRRGDPAPVKVGSLTPAKTGAKRR